MHKLTVVVAGTVAALILGACTSSPATSELTPSPSVEQPSSSPSASASSSDGLDDLVAMDAAVRSVHRDAFVVVPEATWTKQVEQLKAQFPSMTPDERIVAMAGLAGLLDTHTQYFSEANEKVFNAWLYRFPEGLYVVAADDQTLVGTRLVAVNGTPVATIERKIRDLIPADNDSAILDHAWALGYPDYLHGLGIIDNENAADFTVVDRDGHRRTVTVASAAIDSFAETHHILGALAGDATEAMRRRGEALWSRVNKGDKAFLLTLNDYTFDGTAEALDAMTKALRAGTVDHVVIDMRYLLGGDPTSFLPIVDAVASLPRHGSGTVTVLIGRENESAATILAESFDTHTKATLMGEPTPARADNFLCPCQDTPLPSSGYIFSAPTSRAGNGDPRQAVAPDLLMHMTAADFFAGRDKVLKAALTGTLPH